ncbi:hypothetical protein JAAARDRAFT_41713 [Jaapia argillacea MUCL 33604]|uniref:Uncharacterized protein n=1 Tax=Jaapia argillacea MUCL 33604 TaxID=933084 RepID=A0A067PIW2_9AGAM|nr:hypothetical protein JAAARDRAFT_41713 [Jaapia argillacea MUCL 33604]
MAILSLILLIASVFPLSGSLALPLGVSSSAIVDHSSVLVDIQTPTSTAVDIPIPTGSTLLAPTSSVIEMSISTDIATSTSTMGASLALPIPSLIPDDNRSEFFNHSAPEVVKDAKSFGCRLWCRYSLPGYPYVLNPNVNPGNVFGYMDKYASSSPLTVRARGVGFLLLVFGLGSVWLVMLA